MLGKQNTQISFADIAIDSKMPKKVKETFLTKIEKLIDFQPIESILNSLYPSDKGRPGIAPLILFKMSLIQQYYNLSDPELEHSVADRISFRRFVGLSFEDTVPDETTIVRFRQRLIKAGIAKKLLEAINQQLAKHNLFVRAATLIDATLVDSRTKRPDKSEVPTDCDASYTMKRGHIHYGFKAHVSVDAEHNLIEKTTLTTASVHDSKVFEELLPEQTHSVYADKAYANRKRTSELENKGIKSCILDKAYRNHKLSNEQIESNKIKSKTRSNIERVFAHLKRWFGFTKVRYIGISKNALQLELLSISYNLKRAVAILMG